MFVLYLLYGFETLSRALTAIEVWKRGVGGHLFPLLSEGSISSSSDAPRNLVPCVTLSSVAPQKNIETCICSAYP